MISVIIPVYNSEKYLKKCVESVLNQSYSEIELLLINDGSTDDSLHICEKLKSKDKRIVLIDIPNGGVSNARNIGLTMAKGEYISFVDSDDELEPDMYELLVNNMIKHNADISHCGYKRMSENGKILKEVSGTGTILIQNNIDAIKCMLRGEHFVGGLWNKLFKKNLIENIVFDTRLKNNEDILFNVKAFQEADLVVFQDETKYRYYEHISSACNSIKAKRQIDDAILATKEMMDCNLNKELDTIYDRRLYECYLSKLLSMDRKDVEYFEIKEKLLDLYYNIGRISLKSKMKYHLIVNCRGLYDFVYKTYRRIKKPNWDVR